MNMLLLPVLGLMVTFDIGLHVLAVFGRRPLWFSTTRKYDVFWTGYWALALGLIGLLWANVLREGA